jgi:peptide/nickel transport system ATP-binding protein
MAAISQTPVVSVRDLRVTLSRNRVPVSAVNGLTFDLRRGECLTVIGESGSGKSVMLRSLMGLNPANAKVTGAVMVDGQDVIGSTPDQLRRLRGRAVSMIFQEPSTALDPVFTIGDQIVETLIRHEGISRAAASRRALELLELVAIPSAARRLKSYSHEISGGMRQRCVIALALACNPKVLLADEPTTALDATVQIQLLLLLRRLQAQMNMAVIFVTHDMGVASEISDRVAVMYAGRFVETGTTEDVLLSPGHPYTRGLLNSTLHAGMRGKPLRGIGGSPPNLAELPAGCSFAPRCAFADRDCLSGTIESRLIAAAHDAACRRLEALPPHDPDR